MIENGWLGGPVAITGANGQVGRALQKRLADLGNEVRPLGRGDDLREAFRRADAIVHLAGGLVVRKPDSYESANLSTVRATVDALGGSGVRRVVFLSFITADPTSDNPYLRAKGQAERLLAERGLPVVVFRTDHIYGPPDDPGPMAAAFVSKEGKAVRMLGSGAQRLAPIYKGDVVQAIVSAALDPSTPTGTFELAGPVTMTTDGFVQALNRNQAALTHTAPWLSRTLSHVLPTLTPPMVDVLLSDAVPRGDPRETAARFGFELHGIDVTWGG